MKKKSTGILMVLLLSMFININYVKADKADYRCYYASDNYNDKAYIKMFMSNTDSIKPSDDILRDVYHEKINGSNSEANTGINSIQNISKDKTTNGSNITVPKYINNFGELLKIYKNGKCPTYIYIEYTSSNKQLTYITDDSSIAQQLKSSASGQAALMKNVSKDSYLTLGENNSGSGSDSGKVTIDNETWDKVCRYNSGKNNMSLYYKSGLTMIIDTYFGSTTKIYSNNHTSVTKEKRSFDVENNVIMNDGICPSTIYAITYNPSADLTKLWDGSRKYTTSPSKKSYQILHSEEIYIREAGNTTIPDIDNTDNETCEGIINSSLKALINKYLGYIHIIVPIMVLALGVYDFFRAMIASKEDEMKKAQKSFIIRLIAGVLVFLAPTIVNLIITMLNTGACVIG